MINKLKPKSEFSRNVLTLMTGTTIAQAIPIAISPILTRIYTPEDFGRYAVFLSIVMILAPIVTLRYEQAIMLPKKTKDTISLYKGSLYILFVLTLVATFLFPIVNHFFFHLDFIYIVLIPIAILITGLSNISLTYFNRKKKYKIISKVNISTSLSNAGLSLSLGFLISSHLSLSSSIVISKLIALRYSLNDIYKFYKIKIDKRYIYKVLKEYNDMLKFSTPEIFLGAMNYQAIILFLTYFFDPILSGGYFLIQRIFGMPISVFSTSFSKVFFKEFTISTSRKKLLVTTWLKLLLYTIPFVVIFYLYIYDIITFVFGEKWEISAQIAQILLPYFAINFIFSATSTSHITLRLQHLSMYFALVSFFARLIIFYYGYSSKNYIGTIQLVVSYDIAQILFMNYLVFKRVENDY